MEDEDNKKEFELRDSEAPTFESKEDLIQYIDDLARDPEHTYGSVVYAMSLAAVAAFQYVAKIQGVTGFQASCADMDILTRTRRMKGPWKIVDFNDALYPQYSYKFSCHAIPQKTADWLKQQAKELLEDEDNFANPNVKDHWRFILNGGLPTGIRIED